jgi:hypothetical protein
MAPILFTKVFTESLVGILRAINELRNEVFLGTKLTKASKSYSLERYFRGHLKKNEIFCVFFF